MMSKEVLPFSADKRGLKEVSVGGLINDLREYSEIDTLIAIPPLLELNKENINRIKS
jgi:hypothetical protein